MKADGHCPPHKHANSCHRGLTVGPAVRLGEGDSVVLSDPGNKQTTNAHMGA